MYWKSKDCNFEKWKRKKTKGGKNNITDHCINCKQNQSIPRKTNKEDSKGKRRIKQIEGTHERHKYKENVVSRRKIKPGYIGGGEQRYHKEKKERNCKIK